MTLRVMEFEPFRRLAWETVVDGDVTDSSAYHGWVITPIDGGSHVLTEETQQGDFFLEELGRKNPGALYRYHREWVERLARTHRRRSRRSALDTNHLPAVAGPMRPAVSARTTFE